MTKTKITYSVRLINKTYLVAAAASFAMLCGCTSENNFDEVVPAPAPEADAQYVPSGVEVKLGVNCDNLVTAETRGTRAAVSGPINDLTEGLQGMGVFGVATRAFDPASYSLSLQDPAWKCAGWPDGYYTDDFKSTTVCMFNAKASVDAGETTTDRPALGVTLEKTQYYPNNQMYGYDFVAYYPRIESDQFEWKDISSDGSGHMAYVAPFTIDGHTDVIWGGSTSTSSKGWSAFYVQNNIKDGTLLPRLYLNHLLTQLHFVVRAGSSKKNTDGTYDVTAACQLKIKSIKVKNAKTAMQLRVANLYEIGLCDEAHYNAFDQIKNDVPEVSTWDKIYNVSVSPLLDNTLVPDDDSEHPLSDISILNPERDEPIEFASRIPEGERATASLESLQDEWAVTIGEPLLLYPDKTYTIELVMEDSEGQEYVVDVELPTKTKRYIRAYSYTITLVINGNTKVQTYASLRNWTTVTDKIEVQL